MYEQFLETYNESGTVMPARARMQEMNTRFLPRQNVEIRLRSSSCANSPRTWSFA
jgi:hypothetical protein